MPNSLRCYHGNSSERIAALLASGFDYPRRSGDWLGSGLYFWFEAPSRAWQWAYEVVGGMSKSNPSTPQGEPTVFAADITWNDRCLDLLDVGPKQQEFYDAYRQLAFKFDHLAHLDTGVVPNKSLHHLDATVIDAIYDQMVSNGGEPFHAIRAAFVEGERHHPKSNLFEQSHVQVVVRNVNLITNVHMLRR